MLPTPPSAHYNPHWHPQFHAPPPPPAPLAAPAPIYIDAGRGFRRAPRRIVWFALGSAATLWWINSPRRDHSSSWCSSHSFALPSPPAPAVLEPEPAIAPVQTIAVESKDRDSQGRRFGGRWRRAREEEEAARREAKQKELEERWKVDSEKLANAAEEAKEKAREFASTRLDEMLTALTALKKDLTPSSPPPPASKTTSNTPAYFV